MIISHIIDQFYWNDLIFDLGLDPMGISIKKLSVRKLEKSVSDLFSSTIYRRNAELLGEKMGVKIYTEQLFKLLTNYS